MASSGGPPEDPWERIRPAPRPASSRKGNPAKRPAPPEPQATVRRAFPPLPKPDRVRMDPENFEVPEALQRGRHARRLGRSLPQESRASVLDRWLARFGYSCLSLVLGGTGWWFFSQRPSAAPSPAAPPSVLNHGPSGAVGSRVLAMLQAFRATPGAEEKAAFVIDPARVKLPMAAAYQSNRLPEGGLEFGVPVALEPGLLLVPARVAGPPEFLLHLIVQERQGQFLLDWETYEQEMTQRFTAFAAKPGSPAGDFRLMIERAHSFGPASDADPSVRVAAPGRTALVQLVKVSEGARAAVIHSLPWDQRRRALVRLRWETPPDDDPSLVLEEIVRWDFLP